MRRSTPRFEEKASAPAWVVTFADMMGLILCFFILIVSFSSIEQNKITAAVKSVQGALGVMPQHQTSQQVKQNTINMPQRVPRSIERVAREFRTRLQVLGVEDGVSIKYSGDGGLEINLPNQVLFDFGRADLKPQAYEILNQLASSLSTIPGIFVEIRGHTDNVPVGGNSPFVDNYDLSYQRAKNVMLQMSAPGGLQQSATEVIACGPSQPIGNNDTEEGRAANRRVQLQVRGDFSDEATAQVQSAIESTQATPEIQPQLQQ
ncbi:MAG: flagellar motor protein MotB [Candidatus Hydrogenedentes bacterium]|nr:flagellar motor protein MotB [Candidatus Hydrogenedentota bacterium]